jgi:hypothetical protein
MSGYGLGVASSLTSIQTYLPTIGKDAAIIVGAMVAMGLGVALFRKGLHWFRGFVS